MGETALHVFASMGDTAAVRRILPGCDYTYILKKSEFRLTKGLDALHTALIFQQFDIADAILERLQEIWNRLQKKRSRLLVHTKNELDCLPYIQHLKL
jgi:hypothetical protein